MSRKRTGFQGLGGASLLVAILVAACGGTSSESVGSSTSGTSSASAGGGTGGAGGSGAGGAGPSTTAAEAAQAKFWAAFHGQHYDALPGVIADLDAVVQDDPKDAESALLLAHANLWKISEWGRDPTQNPSEIPSFALAAQSGFKAVQTLNPSDARIFGWLGPLDIAVGNATSNQQLVAEGQALVDEGVKLYPEFNGFVRGLVGMAAPASDPAFAAGLEGLWTALDACAGEKVDRKNPDFSKYEAKATTTGPKRVCWDGEMAPHNYEGFFLYMGDMLVKSGDAATAKVIYQNAKVAKYAAAWPFLAELEDRIAKADANTALFTDADPQNDPVLVAGGPTQCATCHATK